MRVDRIRAIALTCPLLVATACGTTSTSRPPTAEPPEPTTSAVAGTATLHESIELLLSHFDIESIVVPRGRAFTRQVALMMGDPNDEELERLVSAVRVGFEAERLREDIAALMLEEAPEGYVEQVATWVDSGSSADVDRQASAYEPAVPLEEWLDTYTDEPPSEARIRLVARWSQARQEGTFFLLLEQALDEAAHAAWRALRPNAPDFDPLSGNDLFARLNQSSAAAVLTALHAHEPIADDLMLGSTLEYESAAGQWYVETYQIAVAEAVRAAGLRVADELRRQGV